MHLQALQTSPGWTSIHEKYACSYQRWYSRALTNERIGLQALQESHKELSLLIDPQLPLLPAVVMKGVLLQSEYGYLLLNQ